jgi:TusA-related sulfurtransferase
MSQHQLDARNLLCPLPVIRAQDRVEGLAPGEVLEVRATDPGVLQDIPAWCRINGHDVLEARADGHEYLVRLRAGSSDPAA